MEREANFFSSIRTTMSVATSVKRYIKSFASDAGQSRISSNSSPTFSSSFVTSCHFWLAANSIWATLVVTACVTVAMRLRIDKSWPFWIPSLFRGGTAVAKFCAEANAAICSNTWGDHLFQWGARSENGAAGEDPIPASDTDEMVLRPRQFEA
jgi:hypothetical protein